MPALTGRSSTPYRQALHTHGALRFFLAASVARIGIAMTGLGIVWLVHGATGSYAVAGTVTGGFAAGAAITGRIVDAFEPRSGFVVALLATVLAMSFAVLGRRSARRQTG